MRGVFVNLDSCSGRKNSLINQLRSAGFSSGEYQRFSAFEPNGDEPQLAKGLKTKGELGLFKSLVSVLAQIGDEGSDAVVHVLEDDVIFPPGGSAPIESVSRLMLSHSLLRSADIVFLDYFLNRELFAHLISRRQCLAPGSIDLIPANRAYLAGTGSFFVRGSSASYLSRLLSNILDSSESLAPVDLTLRTLLSIGAISGFLIVPPLCAPGWDQDEDSTIQAGADPALRLSQRSHVLLRLLASGIQSPYW